MTESPTAARLLPHIERILDAAHLAPSHGNTQPWRFHVDGEAISFRVDYERQRAPEGDRGRTARIAVGAAIECALLRAGRMGAVVRFEPPAPGALVTLTVTQPKRLPEPDKALLRRATNRRAYDAKPLDDVTFASLAEATPPMPHAAGDVRTHWFGRERARTLGPIVEEGDAVTYADPALRAIALQPVRFDVRDREPVERGLSVGSLELSTAERRTLDALRHTPEDRLGALGAFQKMGAHARKLVESASGVCIVSTTATDEASDVVIGRSLQRAWLVLTRKGLVAQPMAAIPVLEALLAAGDEARLTDPARAAAVVTAFRAAFPNVEREARIAVLLRFGWAAPPSSPVRRLPLEESLAVASPADAP